MHTGMFLFGVVCQAAGMFFAADRIRFSESLWFGILLAVAASVHMGRVLDRALADAERTARILTRGYILRYLVLTVILAAAAVTDVLDVLFVFLGYMSMKVTAYLQPITHKFYNMLFHETDPVPQALPDGESEGEEDVPGESGA